MPKTHNEYVVSYAELHPRGTPRAGYPIRPEEGRTFTDEQQMRDFIAKVRGRPNRKVTRIVRRTIVEEIVYRHQGWGETDGNA